MNSKSLRPVDYTVDTRNSSYLTALVRQILSSGPTPTAADLPNPLPSRAETTTFRILRDTKLAREIKAIHNDECQLCSTTIELPTGRRYSEAHHIRPLGGDHGGLDNAENILCLCPNCHAKCDLGAIALDISNLKLRSGHVVSPDSIRYHNTKIFLGQPEPMA